MGKQRTKTFWGSRNEGKTIAGVYREQIECLRPLPEIGSLVVVYESYSYSRAFRGVIADFRPSKNPCFRDAWGQPRVFKVMEYTLGIDNPLDKNNIVVLKAFENDKIPEARIPTCWISCGSNALYVFQNEQEARAFSKGASSLPTQIYPEYL